MAEINQEDTIENKLKPFTDKFGFDTYDEIKKNCNLDDVKNIFVSYTDFLVNGLKNKNEAKKFGEWWKDEKNKYNGVPKGSDFKLAFNRGFKTWLKSQEIPLSDFKQEYDVKETESSPTVELSKLEERLTEILEILNALMNDDSQSMLMTKIMEVRLILDKQLSTKTDKKATYAQVKKLSDEVNIIKMELTSKLDQEKEVTEINDKKRNHLILAGFGAGIGTILLIIGIVSLCKLLF